MGAMTEIRTPRLLLRRWHDDDLAPMADINADPRVMRWIDDGSVRDLDHTAEAIERWEEEWDEEGFGLFAIELLASGELAGFTGLSVPEFLPELGPAVAISWRLGSQFWGQRRWSSRFRTVASTASSASAGWVTMPPRTSFASSAWCWNVRRHTRCTGFRCAFTPLTSPSTRREQPSHRIVTRRPIAVRMASTALIAMEWDAQAKASEW
jgi:hypothetical protein